MSTNEELVPADAADAGESDESQGMSDRTAKIILCVVGLGAAWGIVAAAPWLAYVVVGILLDRGWQKARAWRESRREEEPPDDEPETEILDVISALQRLARGGRHVLLTELRDELDVADTKIVRALLDEVDVPIRSGVRTPAGNGPGVHKDDVPGDSPVAVDSHGERCCCRSDANTNTNNGPEGGQGEGLRVEPIGLAGAVIRDPADTVRHHRVE